MREIDKIAEGLFEKVRDRFEDVSLGDENAKATTDPEKARFFNFDYTVDGKSHGNITLSIIDETSLKVYFSKNISHELDKEQRDKWYSFLRELREFAKRNILSFEPRDITRSTLKHRDIQQQSKSDSTYNKDEVIGESKIVEISMDDSSASPELLATVRHLRNELKNAGFNTTLTAKKTMLVLKDKHITMSSEHKQLVDQILSDAGITYKIKEVKNDYAYTGQYTNYLIGIPYDQPSLSAADNSLNESRLHGTRKSSYEKDGNVKIIIRHSEAVDPEQRGARTRKIKALFVETADGERFRLPHNNLKYARAMAQHVSQGGNVGDDFGCHITKIAEECGKLRPFKSAMIRRTFEDAETQSMVEAAFEYHGLLNHTLKKMGGSKGYAACKESFIADDILMDEFDVDSLRERFVKRSFNDKMEEALPLVQKAYNMKKENKFAQQFESWATAISEGTWALPETDEDQAALTDLLSTELPVGVDAQNATNALYNIFGDDTLFDRLGDLAETNPEADARDTVLERLLEVNPQMYQAILDAIGDEDTPEVDESMASDMADENANTLDASSTYGDAIPGSTQTMLSTTNENYDDEENDSCDAVQAAIIRRITKQHLDLLSQYGPEAITNASRDVAEWVGNVEEIGSSDVSAWVKEVINNLGGTDEIEFERDRDEPEQEYGSDMQFDQDIDSPDQFNRGGEMDEAIGDDYVNKDEKMKRMGAKDLSTLDKVKIMPNQMKAMAKGDSEDDLIAYNKLKATEDAQYNESIAQMRKIAGLGK